MCLWWDKITLVKNLRGYVSLDVCLNVLAQFQFTVLKKEEEEEEEREEKEKERKKALFSACFTKQHDSFVVNFPSRLPSSDDYLRKTAAKIRITKCIRGCLAFWAGIIIQLARFKRHCVVC